MQNKRRSSMNQRQVSMKTIGLIGTAYGVGTTTTAISLGVYLANILHYKVAILEYNENSHFEAIQHAANVTLQDNHFIVSKVDLYPNCKERIWVLLQKKEYDYVVIDHGVFSSDKINTYSRDNYQFLIGSLCEWKRDAYLYCKDIFPSDHKAYNYLVTMGTSYDIKLFYKESGLQLRALPCIYDPFLIVKEVVNFWSKFSLN